MRDLDREVKYLVSKLKLHVPKKKPEEEKTTNKTDEEKTAEKGEGAESAEKAETPKKTTKKSKKAEKENPLKDENLFEGIEEVCAFSRILIIYWRIINIE